MRQVKISGESGMVSTRAEDVGGSLRFKGDAKIQKGAYIMSAAQDLKSFGASLQDVSRNISNVQKKANQALTRNQIAREQADMRRDFGKLDIDNATTLNEEETYNNTKNLYDKYNDKLQTDEFTVESRNHLKQALESYNTSSISKYDSSRASAETKAALAINKQSLEDYTVEGDFEGIISTLDLGVETGLYTESQAQVLAVSYNNTMVMSDSIKTLNAYSLPLTDNNQMSMDDVNSTIDAFVLDAKENGLSGINLEKVEFRALQTKERLIKESRDAGTKILNVKKAGNMMDAKEMALQLPNGPYKDTLLNDINETLETGHLGSIDTLISNATTQDELTSLKTEVLDTVGLSSLKKRALFARIASKQLSMGRSVDAKFDSSPIGKLFKAIEKGDVRKEGLDKFNLTQAERSTAEALAENKLFEEQESVKISGKHKVTYDAVRTGLIKNIHVELDFEDQEESVEYVTDAINQVLLGANEDGKIRLKMEGVDDEIGKVPFRELKDAEVFNYLTTHISTLKNGTVKDDLLRKVNDMVVNKGNNTLTAGSYIMNIKDTETISYVNDNGLTNYNNKSTGLNAVETRRDRNLIWKTLVDAKDGTPEEQQTAFSKVKQITDNVESIQALQSLRLGFGSQTRTIDDQPNVAPEDFGKYF